MIQNFFTCGLTGWCMEIMYTSLKGIRQNNLKLVGNTSVWMFPIYGMASVLTPLFRFMKKKNIMLRGGVYTCFIFFGEYVSGTFLRKFKVCPWDYSHARLNVKGLIRLDYAPLWFGAGLLFEKILTKR